MSGDIERLGAVPRRRRGVDAECSNALEGAEEIEAGAAAALERGRAKCAARGRGRSKCGCVLVGPDDQWEGRKQSVTR